MFIILAYLLLVTTPPFACEGRYECFKNTFSGFGTKLETVGGTSENPARITCNGKKVCADSAQISTDGIILCDGDSACQNSRISATLNITCHGKRACKDTYLQESAVLEAFGMFGAAYSKINKIPSVIGYGFMALAYAEMTSFGVSTMTIDCFGWKTCKGAEITVQKDTSVTLNCLGNGCKGVIIYAQKQCQLIITPTACLTSTIHPQLGFPEYALRDGIYADPAVKATYCPAQLFFGDDIPTVAPKNHAYDHDKDIIEMEGDERAFNIELENSIHEKRLNIEELLFVDNDEKMEEENQYLYGNLHGSNVNNFGVVNSQINYILIGAVSLVYFMYVFIEMVNIKHFHHNIIYNIIVYFFYF